MADRVFLECCDCRDAVTAGTRKRVNHARFGCGCPDFDVEPAGDHFVCGEHRGDHIGSYRLRDGGDLMKWPEPKAAPQHEMKCCGAAFLLAPEEDAPCPNCGAI